MYILNRTARVGQPPQIQAATPVATSSRDGDSSNIRNIINNLEQAFYGLEKRVKILEEENMKLKNINKKLQDQILCGVAVAAGDGAATGEGAATGDIKKENVEDDPEGGQHTFAKETSDHPIDAGEINIVVPITDITIDIPSRIQLIKARGRKRKKLSDDFTAEKRGNKGYYFRKRRRDCKEQVSKETEASDSASRVIAGVLMQLKKDYADPEGGVSSINVLDEPSLDNSPGFIIEPRRNYPDRDKILKEEDFAINFFISQPITKGAIWEDSTERSDSPSISGVILRNFLFGGPTRDEMHILNKMAGIRPDEAITADFIRNVVYDSASVRHFLGIITPESISCNRFIIIPVNSNWHWHLFVIDLKESYFESWNSLWTDRVAKDAANVLAKWFASYFEYILKQRIGHPNVIWQLDCQQQGSTEVDCGMYTCLFAERIVRGGSSDLLVYEKDPPYFRAHIVSQILRDPCCVDF